MVKMKKRVFTFDMECLHLKAIFVLRMEQRLNSRVVLLAKLDIFRENLSVKNDHFGMKNASL